MSQVRRSAKATIQFLVAGLGALGVSALLFWLIASGPITIGIALCPGILGLILLGMAVGGSGVAPCPGCGVEVDGLSTGSNEGVLCAACGKFLEGKDGTLQLTDEARVAETPLFGAILPESFAWPETCCLCVTPPSRRDPVSVTLPNAGSIGKGVAVSALTGGAVTQAGGGTVFTVEVPHCGEHKGGAALGAGTSKGVRIRFRSYPYLRAFCALNKIGPG